jgi:hypothetical protein
LSRAFFFTCDLRRFIFIELRRSCFPTARTMPGRRPRRQGPRPLAPCWGKPASGVSDRP